MGEAAEWCSSCRGTGTTEMNYPCPACQYVKVDRREYGVLFDLEKKTLPIFGTKVSAELRESVKKAVEDYWANSNSYRILAQEVPYYVEPTAYGEIPPQPTMYASNMHQRKYKVNVTERGGQRRRVVFVENTGNRCGAFTMDNRGQATWLSVSDQTMLAQQLADGNLTEARAGQQYRTAMGMVNNAIVWHPDGGLTSASYYPISRSG